LGADEASGNDFGVIEDEEIFWGEEGGEITDRSIGHFSGCPVNMEEARRISWMSGCGRNPIRRYGDRKKFL